MNFGDARDPWARLVAAARQAPDVRDPAAPFGFATRVAARALGRPHSMASLVERFAMRAVGLAALLAVLGIAVNYSAIANTASVTTNAGPANGSETLLPATPDPMTLVLDSTD